MNDYKITKELLQGIVNVLQELPAKNVFHLLVKIDELVRGAEAPKELETIQKTDSSGNSAV